VAVPDRAALLGHLHQTPSDRCYHDRVSEEAENLVLRHLRELRSDIKTGFDQARADTSDLRHDVGEGFTRMTSALTVIARRLDDLDNGIPLADRLSAIEQRLSDLEGRRES
jgi:hypothetical protein